MDLRDEKKVEYIELIYDLIFVYLIGKNASLLDRLEGGFISFRTFVGYFASSLIVLQVWSNTTLFINRYGKNGLAEKLMMLINMFLLYIMGVNTIHGWDANYGAFMGAWCLILVNLAVQYLLKLSAVEDECFRRHIRQNAALLLLQAAWVGISIPVYLASGLVLGPWAVLIGFAAAPFLATMPTNFAHLTERVMLYVVFTFGDMILIVAQYFSDGLSLNALFYALASFLTVAGLFFSYGYVYDKCLDRSGERSGIWYMLLHVFVFFSLSCVTTALDFMRDAEVRSHPKTAMLVLSLLVFFLCLALTERWSVREYRLRKRFLLILAGEFILFAAVMLLAAGGSGHLTAAIAVVFVYVQLGTLLLSGKTTRVRGSAGPKAGCAPGASPREETAQEGSES